MEESAYSVDDFVEETLASEIHSSLNISVGGKSSIPGVQSPQASPTYSQRRSRVSSAVSDDYSQDFDDEASQRSVHFNLPTPARRRPSLPKLTLNPVAEGAAGAEEGGEGENEDAGEASGDDYSMDFDASRSGMLSPTGGGGRGRRTTPTGGKPPRPRGSGAKTTTPPAGAGGPKRRPSALSIGCINEEYSMDFAAGSPLSTRSGLVSPPAAAGTPQQGPTPHRGRARSGGDGGGAGARGVARGAADEGAEGAAVPPLRLGPAGGPGGGGGGQRGRSKSASSRREGVLDTGRRSLQTVGEDSYSLDFEGLGHSPLATSGAAAARGGGRRPPPPLHAGEGGLGAAAAKAPPFLPRAESEYSMDFSSVAASPRSASPGGGGGGGGRPGRRGGGVNGSFRGSIDKSASSFPSYGDDDFEEEDLDEEHQNHLVEHQQLPGAPGLRGGDPAPGGGSAPPAAAGAGAGAGVGVGAAPPTAADLMPSFVPVHIWELRRRLLGSMDRAVRREEEAAAAAAKPGGGNAKEDLIRSRHELEQGLEAIEAELLLVRRKHREDARARAAAAHAKRRRAEERRARHVRELHAARGRAAAAEAAARGAAEEAGELRAQTERMQTIIDASKAARAEGEKVIGLQKTELEELKQKYEALEQLQRETSEKLADLEEKHSSAIKEHEAAAAAAAARHAAEAGVLRAAAAAADRRAEADRAALPEHHARLLRQEEDRLGRAEAGVEAARAQVERERAAVRAEAERAREAALAEARAAAAARQEEAGAARSALAGERRRWEEARAREAGALAAEAARLEAERLARAAQAAQQEAERGRLAREAAALTARAALLAPQLRELDEAQAAAARRGESVAAQAAAAEAAAARAAAEGAACARREQELAAGWDQLKGKEAAAAAAAAAAAQARGEAEGLRRRLEADRLRLYRQQVELGAQADAVKKAVQLLKRLDSTASLHEIGPLKMALELSTLAWGNSATSSMPPPPPDPRVEELVSDINLLQSQTQGHNHTKPSLRTLPGNFLGEQNKENITDPKWANHPFIGSSTITNNGLYFRGKPTEVRHQQEVKTVMTGGPEEEKRLYSSPPGRLQTTTIPPQQQYGDQTQVHHIHRHSNIGDEESSNCIALVGTRSMQEEEAKQQLNAGLNLELAAASPTASKFLTDITSSIYQRQHDSTIHHHEQGEEEENLSDWVAKMKAATFSSSSSNIASTELYYT